MQNYAPMPKVYSYARFSTPEQAAGDSFRRQTAAAHKWAKDRGFELDEKLSFSDEGVSAYRGTNANEDRGLGRFIYACERGLVERGSILLVESLDRLSRAEPAEAQYQFLGVVRQGVTIVTLHDGQEYSQERMAREPWALAGALMVAIRANEESKTKGRRVAAAWEAKRAALRAGDPKRFSLRAPAWLIPNPEGGWQVNEERAAIVRRIYAMTLAGTGEHKIAETLNREGIPPFGRGAFWHRSTICKYLQSSTVIGTLTPGRLDFSDGTKKRIAEEPVPGVYPAIVSEADWLAVRALKDGSTAAVRGRHSRAGVAHILAGLAKCPDCGSAMIRVMKGTAAKVGRPKLVCSAAKVGAGCAYVSVPVHLVEDAILGNWGALFENVPAGDFEGTIDREYDNLAAAIAGTEDHLHNLADALERAPSGLGAVRLQRIEAELRTMRADLAALDERRAYADRGIIRTRLDDLGDLFRAAEAGEPLDRPAINANMKTLFSGVTVNHHNGRIYFAWKQGGTAEIMYAWPQHRDAA